MTTAAKSQLRSFNPTALAQVAVFAALIAALAFAPAIPLGGLGVPITLQTIGIMLAGLCLGPVKGFAATALYLVAGLAGLPIFSGGRAGLAVLAGPSAGYLISFPLISLAIGATTWWVLKRGLDALTPVWLFAGCVAARLLIMWPLGAAGMARALGLDFPKALMADLAFWPGDAIKSVVAVLLAIAVHKAFPRLRQQ